MARLTDIRTPEHHYPHGVKKPAKRSFLKTFFKVITAPVWGPFYLVYLVLRAVKNLLVKITIAIGNLLVFIWTAIRNVFSAAVLAVKNFFSAVALAFKSVFFEIVPKFFPTSWAAWLVFLLALVVIWQIAAAWDFPLLSALDFRQGKWQAVFLSNNQVYFGHLRNIHSNTAVLEDVFYLRNREGGASNIDLVRLGNGNELHGPENILFIPREQIIFWENLREDSQVVQAIGQIQ